MSAGETPDPPNANPVSDLMAMVAEYRRTHRLDPRQPVVHLGSAAYAVMQEHRAEYEATAMELFGYVPELVEVEPPPVHRMVSGVTLDSIPPWHSCSCGALHSEDWDGWTWDEPTR